MTTLYFVRHAQPDYRTGTNRSFPLSEEGMRDRLLVPEVLGKVHFDAAVSSPYKRSIDTILPLVEAKHLTLRTDERLRERDNPGGASNSREMFRRRWADHDFHEQGGESIRSTQERNIAAVNDILREFPNKTVLVGTHGTALASMINYYEPAYGIEEFFFFFDFMPYVLRMDFEGLCCCGREELFYLHKEFHGVKPERN